MGTLNDTRQRYEEIVTQIEALAQAKAEAKAELSRVRGELGRPQPGADFVDAQARENALWSAVNGLETRLDNARRLERLAKERLEMEERQRETAQRALDATKEEMTQLAAPAQELAEICLQLDRLAAQLPARRQLADTRSYHEVVRDARQQLYVVVAAHQRAVQGCASLLRQLDRMGE